MSADGFYNAGAEGVSDDILSALANSRDVQNLVGTPARLYSKHARGASYPYVLLERHETKEAGASGVRASEHVLQFASASRHGGMAEAKAIIGAIRRGIDDLPKQLGSQRITLALPIYCDVMRTQNPLIFRGVLRVRLNTEEV
ncbi:MAG: DUF3168 domain-containing protein [Pseudomonadota bacterium]